MKIFLLVVLTIFFLSCDSSVTEANTGSLTYNLVSLFSYDNAPECNQNEVDMSWFFNCIDGLYQITINDDGTGYVSCPYYCTLSCSSYEDYNQEKCELNDGEWIGGTINFIWAGSDNSFTVTPNDASELSESSFTISGTTLTFVAINDMDCSVFVFDSE